MLNEKQNGKVCGILSKFAESEHNRNLKTLRKTEQNADAHSCGIEKHDGFEQVCGKIAHSNVVVEPVEILTKNGTGKRAE